MRAGQVAGDPHVLVAGGVHVELGSSQQHARELLLGLEPGNGHRDVGPIPAPARCSRVSDAALTVMIPTRRPGASNRYTSGTMRRLEVKRECEPRPPAARWNFTRNPQLAAIGAHSLALEARAPSMNASTTPPRPLDHEVGSAPVTR